LLHPALRHAKRALLKTDTQGFSLDFICRAGTFLAQTVVIHIERRTAAATHQHRCVSARPDFTVCRTRVHR
jgi:hypothetical protein